MFNSENVTVGSQTLLRSGGRVMYAKLAADGSTLFAANTGPNTTATEIYTFAMTGLPNTDEIFVGGGCVWIERGRCN